jgi:hypothetical protein
LLKILLSNLINTNHQKQRAVSTIKHHSMPEVTATGIAREFALNLMQFNDEKWTSTPTYRT